jgi:hypothetical protein
MPACVSHPGRATLSRPGQSVVVNSMPKHRLPPIRLFTGLLGCRRGNGSNSLSAELVYYTTGSGFIADLRGAPFDPLSFGRKVVVCRTNSIIIGGPVSVPRRVTSN